jgi:Uma2 family endonuclease
MQWADVLADPCLRNLPYKIELDRYGNIIMSPASNRHGHLQFWTGYFLKTHLGGDVMTECSVNTPEVVKVADVAWCSPGFTGRYGYQTPYPVAPEICVEVRSPSNSQEEMAGKTALYLQQGAQEVWIVLETGEVRFFGPDGEQSSSRFGIDPRPELMH